MLVYGVQSLKITFISFLSTQFEKCSKINISFNINSIFCLCSNLLKQRDLHSLNRGDCNSRFYIIILILQSWLQLHCWVCNMIIQFLLAFSLISGLVDAKDKCRKDAVLKEWGKIRMSSQKTISVTADVTSENELVDNFGKFCKCSLGSIFLN